MCTFNGQAIESTHSMTNPLDVHIQWLSTFNTTYIIQYIHRSSTEVLHMLMMYMLQPIHEIAHFSEVT